MIRGPKNDEGKKRPNYYLTTSITNKQQKKIQHEQKGTNGQMDNDKDDCIKIDYREINSSYKLYYQNKITCIL